MRSWITIKHKHEVFTAEVMVYVGRKKQAEKLAPKIGEAIAKVYSDYLKDRGLENFNPEFKVKVHF